MLGVQEEVLPLSAPLCREREGEHGWDQGLLSEDSHPWTWGWEIKSAVEWVPSAQVHLIAVALGCLGQVMERPHLSGTVKEVAPEESHSLTRRGREAFLESGLACGLERSLLCPLQALCPQACPGTGSCPCAVLPDSDADRWHRRLTSGSSPA